MAINKARVASELLGLGPGGGGLRKLRIKHDGRDCVKNGPIEALFNPHEITRSRTIEWNRHKVAPGGRWSGSGPEQEIGTVAPETLSLDLFFDTYESRANTSGWKQAASFVVPVNPFQSSDATDVTKLTDRVVKLAEVDKELHRPPLCRLSWARSPTSSPACSPNLTSGSPCSSRTGRRCAPPCPAASSRPGPRPARWPASCTRPTW